MSGQLEKHAFGRYHVTVDISAADYEALTDGLGRPIPFQLNLSEADDLEVKLEDSTAWEGLHFNAGDNPNLVVAVKTDATATAVITAVYPYKPATITINV